GSILRVLVVVDEYAVALFLPPLARREVRLATLHLARDGHGGAAHLAERPPALEPRVDMESPRARRLRPCREPVLREHVAGRGRDLQDLAPSDPGHRVEIDPELVGMIEVARTHRVRVQVDAAEV